MAKKNNRAQLTGEHILPKYIEVTNGHVAVHMEHSSSSGGIPEDGLLLSTDLL
ncbi:hypothetical protein [Xenorhabdus lircayensis]|uniref:Uncharacterized protein n=1 Tax=Xenorhabdus lircayensis TaxID=2763499 RepID=A0ABS0U9G4_9GAMM|nr:hypothetical protein [Xenorhabdus lircayensis]MBI6550518.1 hypothetical protein [Xenorhabdus lircayensis]